MSEDQKPREWILEGRFVLHDRPGGPPGNSVWSAAVAGPFIEWQRQVFVIEKSAYDELAAKLAKAEAERDVVLRLTTSKSECHAMNLKIQDNLSARIKRAEDLIERAKEFAYYIEDEDLLPEFAARVRAWLDEVNKK